MQRAVLFLAFTGAFCAAGRTYELRGRLVPQSSATVSLFGATTPFHAETQADTQGRFRFRSLASGQYTLAVFISGKGDLRQTVDIGPATVDAKGRLDLTILIDHSLAVSAEALTDSSKISARELSIPENAWHEYEEAQKKLGRRDITSAVEHLERAVAIAPQFAVAWNNLGTIAYQARQYARADAYFRKALDENPAAYEPLVNLGGVLLNEGKPAEALPYNRSAVLSRPHDALANSQLGLNYFALGNLGSAQNYLETAKRIDPTHFSYPQLTLARIHLLRNEPAQAADELRDFLHHHPDAPEAPLIRRQLAALDNESGSAPIISR